MTQDRAKTLGNKHFEVAGSYSQYVKATEKSSDITNNNYGGRIGFGVSNNVDIKARYERLVSATENGGAGNYLSLLPKISLWKDKIAIIVPVCSYFNDVIFDSDSRYTIAPEIIGTFTFGKNADITGTVKGDYAFARTNIESDFYYGFKLGMGVSSDLDKWALRPESGVLFNPGQAYTIWSYGVGLIYYFNFSGNNK